LRYRDALLELGELWIIGGEFERALSTLCQAVAVDELHEPAIRALMRLHALDGRRHAALNLFNKLEQQLRQNLGASPAPETQALYLAIQTGSAFTEA
jgi:DNA-binding SARP family transcriptional activator